MVSRKELKNIIPNKKNKTTINNPACCVPNAEVKIPKNKGPINEVALPEKA